MKANENIRVGLVARVEQLEGGNQHLQVDNQGLQSENQRLQVMLEEAQKRIAELEAAAEKPDVSASTD